MDDAASVSENKRAIHEPHKNIGEFHGIFGAIEACEKGRLRGWLFDERSPGRAHVLAVAIDGVVVATVIAALPRADRDSEERRGCTGFDAAIDLSGSSGRELRIFLRDQPQKSLGPILLNGNVGDGWGQDPLGRAAHLFAHVTATHEGCVRRIQHVFDHVTATHEASTRRIQHTFDHVTATHEASARQIQHVFDHVTATHERILSQVRAGAASARLADSGFAGIGQRRLQDQPDDVERAIIKSLIEKALAAF